MRLPSPPTLKVAVAVLMLGLGVCAWTDRATAGDAREERTPYSAWLDFNRLAADRWQRTGLPSWLESIGQEAAVVDGRVVATTFRIRMQEVRNLDKEVQIRLFFDDREGASPKISGWSETGDLRFEAGPLGTGLGLPTSETTNFATGGLDFLEIVVPGDGSNVRGVFLTMMKTEEMKRALDFAPPSTQIDAFGNLPPAAPKTDDRVLYGRVKAPLAPATVKLTTEAPQSIWQFALESSPLLAMVTFEVLGADGLAPLEISVNQRPLGPVVPHLPDLSDPAYRGVVRPLDGDMRFRYAGWLRCQKVIPGSALVAGENRLAIQLHSESGPVAVRAVELQLKYNWKSLDYTLIPALP